MNFKDQFTPIPLNGTAKHKTFRGHVVLDFIDTRTGKITDHVEGENTFTNALDSLLNSNPFGLGKGVFNNTAVNGVGDVDITPLNEIALGGVLIYPRFTNPSNMNDFYEPMSNQPTAYASRLNLSDVDTKLGAFNPIESGAVTNGYKFVYDWATSAGNGVWGAISLCHRRGGQRYYSDSNYMRGMAGYGFYLDGMIPSQLRVLGISNDGIFCQGANRQIISFYKKSIENVNLFMDWHSALGSTPDWTKTYTFSTTPCGTYDETSGKLKLFSTAGGANSVITMITVDPSDWSETSTTINTNVNLCATSSREDYGRYRPALYSMVYLNGYLYSLNSDLTKIYKIDVTNGANVTEIALGTSYSENSPVMATDGTLVYLLHIRNSGSKSNYCIGNDNVLHAIKTDSFTYLPVARRGVWLVSSLIRDIGGSLPVGITPLTSYMATKYELASSVTKTADKTAKLTYTVTEV